MVCKICGANRISTVETRHLTDDAIIRRKICKECMYTFYTKEQEVDYEEIADSIRAYWRGVKGYGEKNRE